MEHIVNKKGENVIMPKSLKKLLADFREEDFLKNGFPFLIVEEEIYSEPIE